MTKIKAAMKLYGNGDPAMTMVREFEERAEELGHSSLVKKAARYAEEIGLHLQLEYPNPTCVKHDSGEVITAEKLKAKLRSVWNRRHGKRYMNRTGRETNLCKK